MHDARMHERLCLRVLGRSISEPTATLMFLTRLPEIPLSIWVLALESRLCYRASE